jgi:hypothetical protein
MPIQKLKNILAFTGLTVGVPVVRAHGLTWNPDRKVIPDICLLDEAGYTVTADDTNVTITRTTGPADVNMLVESWHTIERAFGASSIVHLTPQPIVIEGAGSGGAGTTVKAFSIAVPSNQGTDDVTIAIPGTAMADANYAIAWSLNLVDPANQYGLWIVQGSKLVNQFEIMIGALPTSGDTIDFVLVPYSS